MHFSLARSFTLFCLFAGMLAAAAAEEPTVKRDLEYARAGDISLALDLYLPTGEVRPPLIAWVHGGAWRAGSKTDMPLKALVAQGFAVASIEYRLSTVAQFPAQAHDLKAAIRFLRAKAGEYGLDGRNIAIAGGSAGGHLAALIGTSNGVPELEGTEGAYLTTSSEVQAIVSFYGGSNLQSILSQSTPHGLSVREPALRLLLGALPDEKPELARLASPVAHVRPGAPPLLLIHGDADPQMPFAQARELQQVYENAKLPVTLEAIVGGKHGGPEFYDEQRLALVARFLADAIRHPQQPLPAHADISYGPSRHQVVDVYLPPATERPAAALLWFGGIWQPSKAAPNLDRFLKAGVAVVAVETRTMNDAVRAGAQPPIAFVMNDAVRAVQYVRHHAAEWRVDPKRIAAGGSSQGSLPALYLGCAGERAQAEAADPIERESSQVIAVGAHRSQPSIDPQRMQEWVSGVKWGAPAFGVSFEESLARRAEFLPIIEKWSPDALLHRGAAPIYFENNWPLTQPEGVKEPDYQVHSPAWALGFQRLAEQASVECHVQFPGHPVTGYTDVFDFLIQTVSRR
jgi:acetyl esterase/lipase